MDALLLVNNDKVQNLRVIVQVTDKKLKQKVISLLEQDKAGEAFDMLFSHAEVRFYLPGDKPAPRLPFLLMLDEELLKSKAPQKLSTPDVSKDETVCYN